MDDKSAAMQGGNRKEERPILVKRPTNYLESLAHFLKGNLGIGLYAMGDGMKNAGILLGPALTVVLGIMSTHCMHLLIRASEKMQEKTNDGVPPDFATTVELSFENGPHFAKKISKPMRRLVNTFLCLTQLGFCCIYFVFISSNIKEFADKYVVFSVHLHMLLILPVIILTCLVTNLKFLAPVSIGAIVIQAAGLVIIFHFIAQNLPPFSSRSYYVATIRSFPLFFGTVLFAFEGIGFVLQVKNEMKHPEQMGKPFGTVNMGMFLVTLLYVCFGLMSYWQFGDDVKGSVTLNFPQDTIVSKVVQILIALVILFTYAVQFYIPVVILLPYVMKIRGSRKHPLCAELVFRTCLVLLTFVLAEVIPYLNLFISLVGASASTALALLIPPLLEFATSKITVFMIIKNTAILLIGVLGCITGTYESISSIVELFKNRTVI